MNWCESNYTGPVGLLSDVSRVKIFVYWMRFRNKVYFYYSSKNFRMITLWNFPILAFATTTCLLSKSTSFCSNKMRVQNVARCCSALTALFSTLLAIYWSFSRTELFESTISLKPRTLFVGIVSSPDNFQERKSLRDTWLKEDQGHFDYKFLIGQELCDIHPLDRTSQYNCEKLSISVPKSDDDNRLLHVNTVLSYAPEEEIENIVGFDFYVHHPIEVELIGVKTGLRIKHDVFVKIILLNSSSTKLASVIFDGDSVSQDRDGQGYIFKKLTNPVLLPRGFEGSIQIASPVRSDNETVCDKTTKWTHRNLFTIHRKISISPTMQNSKFYCVLPTFSFSIKEVEQLNRHLNQISVREVQWLEHNEKLAKIIQEESDTFKDILFLDLVDVYHNLPGKVYQFLKWVYKNHDVDYILKTDDDTFIDIPAVKLELEKSEGWSWWSCFRVGWPVQRYGRHRETVYIKEVYPVFPCGAGYILSKDVLSWLIQKFEEVPTFYQGEDVSIGIWLEGYRPRSHVGEECNWACDEHCHARPCNVMQLTVEKVYKIWSEYKKCGNKICSCTP